MSFGFGKCNVDLAISNRVNNCILLIPKKGDFLLLCVSDFIPARIFGMQRHDSLIM